MNATRPATIPRKGRSLWLLVGVLLIAAFVRLITLTTESLWYDETFTAWLATRLPLDQMIVALRADKHPPLFYLIEWGAVQLFGPTSLGLRWIPFLFGVLMVALAWRISLEVGFRRGAALTAALIMAVLPATIYFSQEARNYTIFCCAVMVMVWGALRSDRRLLIGGGLATIYLHNIGLFYVFVLGLALLIITFRDRRQWWRMVGVLAVLMACWLPWGVVTFEQLRDIQSKPYWVQALTPGTAVTTLPQMTLGWRAHVALQLPTYAVAYGATAVGLITARQWLRTRRGAVLLAVIFGVPIFAAAVSVLVTPIFLPRTFLPSTVLATLFWAYAAHALSAPNRRVVRHLVAASLLIGLTAHYFPMAFRQNIPAWVEPLQRRWQAGDVIFYTAGHAPLLFGYYLPDKPYLMRPDSDNLYQTFTESEKVVWGFVQGNAEQAIALAKQNGGAVWVLIDTGTLSRQDEFEEIERLRRTYAPEVVREQTSAISEQAIWRIQPQ